MSCRSIARLQRAMVAVFDDRDCHHRVCVELDHCPQAPQIVTTWPCVRANSPRNHLALLGWRIRGGPGLSNDQAHAGAGWSGCTQQVLATWPTGVAGEKSPPPFLTRPARFSALPLARRASSMTGSMLAGLATALDCTASRYGQSDHAAGIDPAQITACRRDELLTVVVAAHRKVFPSGHQRRAGGR
jgi:hypothetical protein